MDVAVLFSGGKDSCYALWYAFHQGWRVQCLITVRSANPESYLFHYPNVRWVEAQAKALRLPVRFIDSSEMRNEEVNELLRGLKRILREVAFTGLVSGVIASDYQRSRVDRLCEELGLASLNPLWKKDPYLLLWEELEAGFEMIVTACMAMGLGREWLGSKLTTKSVLRLKALSERYGFNPAFEGGEGETFVLDAPFFHEKLRVVKHKTIWEGSSGRYVIEDLQAMAKPFIYPSARRRSTASWA